MQKPFGLSLSKAFPSPRKKAKRFDRLTANGAVQRSTVSPHTMRTGAASVAAG